MNRHRGRRLLLLGLSVMSIVIGLMIRMTQPLTAEEYGSLDEYLLDAWGPEHQHSIGFRVISSTDPITATTPITAALVIDDTSVASGEIDILYSRVVDVPLDSIDLSAYDVTRLEHKMAAAKLTGPGSEFAYVTGILVELKAESESEVMAGFVPVEIYSSSSAAIAAASDESSNCDSLIPSLPTDTGRYPPFDPCRARCLLEWSLEHQDLCTIRLIEALMACGVLFESPHCLWLAAIAEAACVAYGYDAHRSCCQACGTREPPPFVAVQCTPTP